MAKCLRPIVSLLISYLFVLHACWALPIDSSSKNSTTVFSNSETSEGVFYDKPVDVNNVTYVPKDLIVIRTFIYEVGILTDADSNETDDTPQIRDEINIRTFEPPKNTTVDWWKAFDSNATEMINAGVVAFERILPLGMTVLPDQAEQRKDRVYDVITTDENNEESEEENAIDLL